MICILNYVFFFLGEPSKNHIPYWWAKDGIDTEPDMVLPIVIHYL